MLKNLVNLSLILLCTSLDSSSTQQYCNKTIVTQKTVTEEKPYITRELFKQQCPFTKVKLDCPFWRNVTKYETVDKVVSEEIIVVVCCDGYFLVNNELCMPLCKDQCINGNCTLPDECTCWEGYNKSTDKNNICNPMCSDCINGDCIAPNECRCHKGYVEDPTTSICEPFCGDNQCGFGHCQEPYNCKCIAGYEKDGNGRCTVESCPTECKGGSCRNGNCECAIGAEWVIDISSCICPTCPTTLQTETTETETRTILCDSTTTATMENSSDDLESLKYQKNLLITGLLGIILLLSLIIITILIIIWWKKRGLQNYNSSYTMRYQGDQVLIQTTGKC